MSSVWVRVFNFPVGKSSLASYSRPIWLDGWLLKVPWLAAYAWGSRDGAGERVYPPLHGICVATLAVFASIFLDARGGAYADDSRVPAVISALKGERSIVCDLGLWGPRCAEIGESIDVLILLGHGDAHGAARLCALSAANPPPCPTYALIAPQASSCFLACRASIGLISPSQITRIVHTSARPVYAVGMRPRQGRRGRKARAQLWERMEAQE